MNINNKSEKAIVLYPVDGLNLKLVISNSFSHGVIDFKCFEDENGKYWGEYIFYYSKTSQIHTHGFYADSNMIGVLTCYDKDGSVVKKHFYSFEEPGKVISENEYKRQLAKIRLGVWKVPALDLKISDYEK